MLQIDYIRDFFKYFTKELICKNVSDDNLNQSIYHGSLLLGIQGYKNYAQASQELGISSENLRYIISTKKNEIFEGGKPFHHPIFGKNNLLSLVEIKKIRKILRK